MGILIVTVAVTATMGMILATQPTTRHDDRFVDAGQAFDAGVQRPTFAIDQLPGLDQTSMKRRHHHRWQRVHLHRDRASGPALGGP